MFFRNRFTLVDQALTAHFRRQLADAPLGAKTNLPGRDFQFPVLRLARVGRDGNRLVEGSIEAGAELLAITRRRCRKRGGSKFRASLPIGKSVAMAPFLYDRINLTEIALRIDCPHSARECQLAGLQFMSRAGAKQ